MRQITGRTEPSTFINWKKKNINNEWEDFSGSEEYNKLRKQLIKQQDKMCCYCEIALKEDINAHIEHIQAKHHYPQKRFDFENLYASCQHQDSCGHEKGSSNFANMILPNMDCQSYFTYTRNGKIIPAKEGDANSQKTIDLLGLNCKRLKRGRESIIKSLEDLDETIKNQYLQNCVEWVNGFYTVIEYMKN